MTPGTIIKGNKMGMDAGVTIYFYDKDGKRISEEYVDCYKCGAIGERFETPADTNEVKVCFSTEYDNITDSDSSESEDGIPFIFIDFERLLATCREVIDANAEKRDYWLQLKCAPEVLCSFIAMKMVEMEKDPSQKDILDKLTSFEEHVNDHMYYNRAKPILEILEFMSRVELDDSERDDEYDYKHLVEIILECFDKGAQLKIKANE